MNLIVQLEFEFTHYDSTVQHFNHFTTRTNRQISSDTKYFFPSCPKHCDWGLIVVIVYYFQIWNKKEHNIIITSFMGPMYIKIPYTYINVAKNSTRKVTVFIMTFPKCNFYFQRYLKKKNKQQKIFRAMVGILVIQIIGYSLLLN